MSGSRKKIKSVNAKKKQLQTLFKGKKEIDLSDPHWENKVERELTEAIGALGEEFLADLSDVILADAQSRLTGDKKLDGSTDPNYGGAFDTGRLHASADWIRISAEEYEVGFEAPYAADVEYGLDPSQVDATLKEITAWAKRKRIDNYKTAARRIHKSIHKKGIGPKPYLRMALAFAMSRSREIADKTEKRLKK